MKIKGILKKPAFWVSAGGVTAAVCMYIYWLLEGEGMRAEGSITPREYIAGFAALAVFVALCLQFVPKWFNFWSRDCSVKTNESESPKGLMPKIFAMFLIVDFIYILIVALIQYSCGETTSLEFWRCLDSDHYLNIAKDGYLSEGTKSRLVELVFLPGYPAVVGIVNILVRNYVVSGLIVSALFFGAAGCMFYKVLRLDYSHEDAMRTIKYLLICPGVFFFVAPMSESLFLFMCLLCIYCVRTGKVTRGCFAGMAASFTRSVGIGLTVPVFFELVHKCMKKDIGYPMRRRVLDFASMLIIPAGFALYCLISYNVSGDPLKFMEYQSEHWGQNFGFFFAKVAEQFERVLICYDIKHVNLIGMWLPNFVCCFFGVVMMNLTVKKIRPSYTAWFIIYYAITIGTTALLSGPRYLMVCFPLLISLMLLTKNKYADRIFTVLCVVWALIYTYAFVMRWCVW